MDNPQDLKKAILAVLAEKGDYATLLKHLDTDEKKEKGDKMYKLIEPISAFADLLTQNNEGAFMEKLTARMDGATKEALDNLSNDIAKLREELQTATTELLNTSKSELVAENLARYQATEKALAEKMLAITVQVAGEKANEMFGNLAVEAKLTEDEINDIIEAAALSVESQITTILGEFIEAQGIEVEQINGFAEAVRALLPQSQQVTWDSIVGKPEISQGGTSAILVKQMIDAALEGFSGTGVPDGGTTGQVLTKLSNADGDATWQDPTGGSGVINTKIATAPQTGTTLAITGALNGTNTVYATPTRYVSGTLVVLLDGREAQNGDEWNETTPSAGTFTFVVPPPSDSRLTVYYQDGTYTTPTQGVDDDLAIAYAVSL